MSKLNYKNEILELLEKGSMHRDDIYHSLIKKHNIAKKEQKKFKTNLYVNYITKLIKERLVVKSGKNVYNISIESNSPSFVNQFAESISIDKLSTLKTLARKFRTKTGFYFLYSGEEVYYIGIGNVMSRLVSHTKDEHKGKWDYFNFYITERIEHAKEIETIVQRNIRLKGNKNIGKLQNAKDLSEHINTFANILQDLK